MSNARNRRHADTVDVSLERGQVAALVVGSILALGTVFLLGVGMGKRLAAEPAAHRSAVAAKAKVAVPAGAAAKVPALTFHDALTKRQVHRAARPAKAHHDPSPAARAVAKAAIHALAKPKAPAHAAARPKAPAQAVAEAAPAPAARPAPTGGYSIQVASSKDAADTRRLAKRLVAAGYDARVVPVDIPGRGRWYRVRVGHFDSRENASLKQAEIKVAVNLSGIVVPD